MAGAPVIIIGKMTDKDGNTQSVQIEGIMGHGGLDVGMPLPQPPQPPNVIWPGPGYPAHPIVIPPSPPNVIWPSPGHPAHPIAPGGPPGIVSPPIFYPPEVWPPIPPDVPPPEGGGAPGEGTLKWFYSPTYGWVLVYIPGGGGKPRPPGEVPPEAQPKG